MYDMFEEMRRMQEEMDRMFDDFFRVRRPTLAGPAQKAGQKGELVKKAPARSPVCNICETEKNVLAAFEIPGVDKADISLNVTENSIEVSAKRKVEKEVKDDKGGAYSYYSSASQFYRHLPLPRKVVPDKAVATYKDGMLRVEMPKVRQLPQSKGHNVQIR